MIMMAVDPASPAPAIQILGVENPNIAAPKMAIMATVVAIATPVVAVGVGGQRRNDHQNGQGPAVAAIIYAGLSPDNSQTV